MAYRVLIADDEYFIRQRLKKIICWEEWGLEFAGEAENGVEVCDKLARLHVDILLLDIRMPKMDGLEVCRKLGELSPSTKVIILSGFNDFEYVRNALQAGVFDYLLKPIQQAELQKSLFKCIEKIKSTHEQSLQLEQYYHYKKCDRLFQVMSEEIPMRELYAAFPEFVPVRFALFAGVYIYNSPDKTILSLVTAFRASGYHCEFIQEADHIYAVQFFFEQEPAEDALPALLQELCQKSTNHIFYALTPVFRFTEPWRPHYTRSIYQLYNRFFSNSPNLSTQKPHRIEGSYNLEMLQIRQQLTKFIRTHDNPGMEQYLVSLFDAIRREKSADFLIRILTEIFTCYQLYWNHQELAVFAVTSFLHSILEEEYDLDQLLRITVKYGNSCFVRQNNLPNDSGLANKLVRYIDANYTNPKLSVAMIADHFQSNPSYLGTVFKKLYDISLLQYITKIRMEKAVEYLIQGNYRIFEIADLVGYSDVFYFSKKFKKYYNCSPSSYLASHKPEAAQSLEMQQ